MHTLLQNLSEKEIAAVQASMSWFHFLVKQLYNFTTCSRLEISLLGLESWGGPTWRWIFFQIHGGVVVRGKDSLTEHTYYSTDQMKWLTLSIFPLPVSLQVIWWCMRSRNSGGESSEDGGDGGGWRGPHHHRHTITEGKIAGCRSDRAGAFMLQMPSANARIRLAQLKSSNEIK